MIRSVRGKVLILNLDSVVIETSSGIGYEVFIPFPVHYALKSNPPNQEVFLYTYHSIGDRGQKLFGFLNEEDREIFLFLQSMNGIGEMTALKILSFYNLDSLYQIAISENKELLEKIPKLKGKTSEKILFELKQNLKKMEILRERTKNSSLKDSSNLPLPKTQETLLSSEQKELAILGLVRLGFSEKEAQKAVEQVWNQGIQDASMIVREILKKL